METYYTTPIKSKATKASAWSQASKQAPLLAVPFGNNAVGIYTSVGQPLDQNNEGLVKNIRACEAVRLAWHPFLPLLAVGWKDGAISFWNSEQRHLEEDSKTHRSSLLGVQWNNAGDRFGTCDEQGKVALWKTDKAMRPIPIVSFDEPGSTISHLTFAAGQAAAASDALPTATLYFVATTSQRTAIMWADDTGRKGEVQEVNEAVIALLNYPEKRQLLAVTTSGQIITYEHAPSSRAWTMLTTMRLPGAATDSSKGLHVAWAGQHTLAMVSGKELLVRLFNFDTEDNYILQLGSSTPQGAGVTADATAPCCLDYDARHDELAVGLRDGRVQVFRRQAQEPDTEALDLAKTWDPQPPFQVEGEPMSIRWGPVSQLLAVAVLGALHACRRAVLQQCVCGDWAAMQVSGSEVMVEALGSSQRSLAKVRTKMQVQGLDLFKDTMLLYDGKAAELYRFGLVSEANQVAAFESPSCSMALHSDTVFRVMENRVEAVTFSGTVKQTLQFEEELGRPTLLSITGNFLAVCTNRGQLKVFKVGGREARPFAGPGSLLPQSDTPMPPDQNASPAPEVQLASIRVNCTGQLVSGLLAAEDGSPDSRVVVFSSETNTVYTYDFAAEQRIPLIHTWDLQEPKLLTVQTRTQAPEEGSGAAGAAAAAPEIATLFAAPEHGIILQEYQRLPPPAAGLAAVTAPYMVVSRPNPGTRTEERTCYAEKILLQSFAGMESVDEDTKRALLDFSYHLAVGDMEEAFRAVKSIRNRNVWHNLALLSIKRRNLDIAEHCLGQLEHVRGARAVREAREIEELDARIATVAVHLGLVEEAQRLYTSCERFDLLGVLCRAAGQWEKALDIADKHDRIHLKPTHYAYARHMEQMRDFKRAISHYEQASTAQQEVPRMLHGAGRLDELERYVHKSNNKELAKWWARYCESKGDLSRAAACYQAAGDHLALVRLHVHSNNWRAAESAALESNDPAACFHLARQYEAQEKVQEAIRFFALAQRHSHAVRLAKQYELDSDLLALAMKSSKAAMLEAADYLAERGQADKAATLYLKAGKLRQAVDMCFEGQLFEVLQQVADDLDEGSDPVLLGKCAEFFLQHGQHAKAAKILSATRDPAMIFQAVDLCLMHGLHISEEMAEALTPEKGAMPAEERTELLLKIAKAAKQQGQWHLACKKYTQAGDKLRAMKALIKSCDVEKITFFANVSRQKEIYLMAANYLQTLNWHSDPEVMASITTFYKKAGAHDHLSAFFEACAQIEVDEYRDYDKGLQALREAVRHAAKSKSADREERLASLNQRIAMSEAFLRAKQLMAASPQQALALCDNLLAQMPRDGSDVEPSIRMGDVYALMIEYWYDGGNMEEAYALVARMQDRGIVLTPYLDQHMLETIFKAAGLDWNPRSAAAMGGMRHQQVQQMLMHAADDDDDNGGFVEEEMPLDEDD